jgi:hypothetical protein
MKAPLFVELCAGLASVSLMLDGGKYARPPVSRMGNKHGYGLALLRIMGLRPGQGADRYLWCEPDPGCRALLHAYTDREVMQEAARIIRSWKDEEPRALWERLRAEGPIRVGEAREVARYGLVRSWGHGSGCEFTQRAYWGPGHVPPSKSPGWVPSLTLRGLEGRMERPTLPATVTPDARAVDPREVARWATVQRWGYGNAPLDADLNIAARTGEGTFGPNNFGTTETTANGLDRTPTLPATVTPDARPIEPADLPPGTVVFMDPPYVGTTGYGNDLPREDVVMLARRWLDAGARVYISEAEPLPSLVADGWHAVEITSQRSGQKRTFSKQQREWVTCSHPPAWRPAEQRGLFPRPALPV